MGSILADLHTLEKAVVRLEKEAKVKKDRKPYADAAKQAQEILNGGRTLFHAAKEIDGELLKELSAQLSLLGEALLCPAGQMR